jgi:hypothetical protein
MIDIPGCIERTNFKFVTLAISGSIVSMVYGALSSQLFSNDSNLFLTEFWYRILTVSFSNVFNDKDV